MRPPDGPGRPPHWRNLRSGAAVLFAALVISVTPPPQRSVADWATAERVVAPESGSPEPGKWSNDLTPYTVEPMDCVSFKDPCREVTLIKSHQVGGSEIGVNLFGYVVDQAPSPMAIVLPTIEEGNKYERLKLQPTITATPALAGKVRTERSRSRDGSTVTFKRFRGGYAQITGANSSVGLQMISVRVAIFEEISEWPDDTGNRGDPLAQAEKRLTAWSRRKPKRFYVSTPKTEGTCRITEKYEASDQRRYYVPCPQCGAHQHLRFEQVKWRSDHAPHGAYLACAANGCVIEHHQKRQMVALGVWIRTYPDEGAEPGQVIEAEQIERFRARDPRGREPGFHIWQVYSPFVDWDDMVSEWLGAKDNPLKEKVFVQQILGQAYAESGDAPDWEKLYLRRESYPLGRIPPGALNLTGMADVQVNRIEWAVYGWGIGLTGWLVDKGIIEGDPANLEIWQELDAVVARRYPDWQDREWSIDAFGVDAGYLSNMVYLFCRRDGSAERAKRFALDGRAGFKHPPVGTPKRVSVSWRGKRLKGGAMLWPTGTWPLKSWLYASLRKTIDGPDENGNWPLGALHFPDACDAEFFKQITAEFLNRVVVKDRTELRWQQIKGQANEQLDIIVGARALASHLRLDDKTRDDWAALATARNAPPDQAQRDLSDYWSMQDTAEKPRPRPESAAPAQAAPVARSAFLGGFGRRN